MKTRTENTFPLSQLPLALKSNRYDFDTFKLISDWKDEKGILKFFQFFNTELVSLFFIPDSAFSTSVSAEVFTTAYKSLHYNSQPKRQSAKSTQFLGFHNEIMVLEKPCRHFLATEIFTLNTRIKL